MGTCPWRVPLGAAASLASGDPSRDPREDKESHPHIFLSFSPLPWDVGVWSQGWLRVGWGADVCAQLDACPDVRGEGMPRVMFYPRGAFQRPPSARGPPLGCQRCCQLCAHVCMCTHMCKGRRTPLSVPFHARIRTDMYPGTFPHLPDRARLSGGAPNHGDPPWSSTTSESRPPGRQERLRADTSLPAAAAEAGSAAVAGAGSGRARWGHGGHGRLRGTGGTGRSEPAAGLGERPHTGCPGAGILRRGPWRRRRRRAPTGA